MLALVLALAASPAPAAVLPDDGTYTYVSSMGGVPIGKTVITVKRDPAGSVVLSERGAGTYNGEQGTVSDTLTLDSALAPTAYAVNANVDGRAVKMSVAFKGGNAVETGDVTQKTYDLAQAGTHFVVLDFGPFSGWFALPAQMQAWSDAPAIAIVPAMGSGVPIAPDASLKTVRPKNVPPADAVMNVSSPMPFAVWYDPKNMLVDRLDFPTQGVSISRQP